MLPDAISEGFMLPVATSRLATPSGERVNHQSSVTLLCLNYKWGLFSIIKQICHASGGNMMECFPEGGWFSRGRSPRENHPPEGKHSIMLPPLAWHICILSASRCNSFNTQPPTPGSNLTWGMWEKYQWLGVRQWFSPGSVSSAINNCLVMIQPKHGRKSGKKKIQKQISTYPWLNIICIIQQAPT